MAVLGLGLIALAAGSRIEERHLALPVAHPLTGRSELTMADLYDEPFLALPESTGLLRRFWLGEDARNGHRARVVGPDAR